MKIDADLRMAVRSAYNVNRLARTDSWAQRRKAEQEAIKRFLKSHPGTKRTLAAACAKIETLRGEIEKANAVIHAPGLGRDSHTESGYGICDSVAFAKAGGKFNYEDPQKWTFDQVMAQLAAADEKDATAILAKFGIKWK